MKHIYSLSKEKTSLLVFIVFYCRLERHFYILTILLTKCVFTEESLYSRGLNTCYIEKNK